MPSITNFPNEILERIFLKGCEDDLAADDEAFCKRDPRPHLKPFVALASKVCNSWRRIITTPSEFQRTHYYVAELSISFSEWGVQLVRDCIRFKTSLSKTYGSDIIILFDMPVNSDRLAFHGELVAQKEFEAKLKLFLNLFHAVIPYRGQIVSIRMHTIRPQVAETFWQLLTSHIREAPRLVEVISTPHELTPYFLIQLGHQTLGPDNPPNSLLPKLWEASGQSHSYSLEHLNSLDTMALADVLWLENPQHMVTTTRLRFFLAQPVTKLLDIFHIRHDIAGNLTSLEITQAEGFVFSQSLPSLTTHEPPPRITLQSLLNLHAKLELPMMRSFLDQTEYPSIDVVMITLLPTTLIESLPSILQPDIDGLLDLMQSEYFCHAKRLALRTPDHGKAKLHLEISRVEHRPYLEETSTFVPGSISVKDADYRATVRCLQALDLSQVKFMKFECYTFDREMLRFSDTGSIQTPSLQSLTWCSNLPDHRSMMARDHFLSLLDAPSLLTVDVQSVINSRQSLGRFRTYTK